MALFEDPSVSVDVVLLDMMMPGLDGTATMQALKAIRSDVPLIASSGLRRPHGTDSIAGYDAFLAKPYTDRQLLQTVRRVLQATSTRTKEGLEP